MLKIRDREFQLSEAYIKGNFEDGKLHCFIEVETIAEEYDEELWEPYLRHQGFIFNVSSWKQLSQLTESWGSNSDSDYSHPEIGILYVFGHEPTYQNMIKFGECEGNEIDVYWSGMSNLYWSEGYNRDVPFLLQAKLRVINE